MNLSDRYDEEYEKLTEVAQEITPYYDIDKVKGWSVYIWTKGDNGSNVFDIETNEIVYYHDFGETASYTEQDIIEEAKPIINKIQNQLKVLDEIGKKLKGDD